MENVLVTSSRLFWCSFVYTAGRSSKMVALALEFHQSADIYITQSSLSGAVKVPTLKLELNKVPRTGSLEL